ncbi:MAG: VanZ family protein [Clostridia bacterium]|nr:VanZ family protein [Clostridia bacterium]
MVKTKTLWRVMLWVLTLAWGGTILGMSLQSGPQSTALSSGFTAWFLHLFKAYNALPEAQQLQVLAQAQAVVRELAHVAEYTLFGFFVSSLWRSYRTCRFSLWSFLSAAVFAVVDECLQEFVSVGRAFQVIDLAKDWLGIAFGIGCTWAVCLVIKRIHYRRT